MGFGMLTTSFPHLHKKKNQLNFVFHFHGGIRISGFTHSLTVNCYSQVTVATTPVVTLFLDNKVNYYKNLRLYLGLVM